MKNPVSRMLFSTNRISRQDRKIASPHCWEDFPAQSSQSFFGKCFGWGSLRSRIIFLSLGTQHPMAGNMRAQWHNPLEAGHNHSLISSSVPSCSFSSHTPKLLVTLRAYALINLPYSHLHFIDYFLGHPWPMAAGREEL